MLKIENKIEFENNLWVGLVDSSTFNRSEKDRIKAVTDIASITTGRLGHSYISEKSNTKLSKRRLDLYNRLLKESAGNPSTPFEFIPVKIKVSHALFINIPFIDFQNKLLRFSYIVEEDDEFYILTNLRTLLNIGIPLHNVPFNTPEELKGHKTIVGKVPAKVFPHHLRTHRLISPMSESSRNKKYLNEVEFWYPSWWETKHIEYRTFKDIKQIEQLENDISVRNLKPEEATMELSDRRLVHFAMAAWKQDENAWNNLFAVRGNKTGTMNITEKTVEHVKTLIG